MPVNSDSTMNHALEFVRERYPDLPLDEKMVLLIINQEVVSGDALLKSGDIISFLPDIGGG